MGDVTTQLACMPGIPGFGVEMISDENLEPAIVAFDRCLIDGIGPESQGFRRVETNRVLLRRFSPHRIEIEARLFAN